MPTQSAHEYANSKAKVKSEHAFKSDFCIVKMYSNVAFEMHF